MTSTTTFAPGIQIDSALQIRTATEPFEISQLRRFLVPQEARRPNLASQCLGLALRRLPDAWQERHGIRPLLVESFHDPEEHTGTLYKAANWTPLGFTKGFKRHRADFYQGLGSPKQLWIRPLQKNARQLLGQPGTFPEEHRKGIAETTCGAPDVKAMWAKCGPLNRH